MEKLVIGNRTFVISKMDCFKQLDVARRLGPILSDLVPAFQGLAKGKEDLEKMTEEEKLMKLVPLGGPIVNGIAKLTEDDFHYVRDALLECVEVENGKIFSKLLVNGTLMFQDLDMPTLLQIMGRVLWVNLGNFFPGLLQ